MRRVFWLLVVIAALAVLWSWVPSLAVERQIAAVLRARLEASGPVTVRARTTLVALAQERVERIDIEARGVRLGDLVADRLTAKLEGVAFRRAPDGVVVVTNIQAGAAEIEITEDDLERYLGARGVDNPSVHIDKTGVSATGGMRVGPVLATARLRGQFYAVDGRDLYFRVTSLEVSGVDVPRALAETVLAVAAQPVVSVRHLPVSIRIDRIDAEAGRVVVHARAEMPAP